MRSCAAVLLALVLVTGARAFTVDCNAEYADCDSELKKEGEETTRPQLQQEVSATTQPMSIQTDSYMISELKAKDRSSPYQIFPKPRLFHLDENPPDLFSNRTEEKQKKDLSDVNLDSDDEHSTETDIHEETHHRKVISDSFFSNLQAPFHSLMNQEDPKFEAAECKDQNEIYMIGEHIERGCEESCECMQTGLLECSPRCKHPYIRRGRKLSDPLCFESPVDECCSIVACTTTNPGGNRGETDGCRYSNQTYRVGAKWNIGCDQVCSCEAGAVLDCKPRCKTIPQKENCINVQDPNDNCCEIQVCDVSHDDHEEPDSIPRTMMDHNTVPMTTMPAPTTAMEDPNTLEDILRFTSKAILSPSLVQAQQSNFYNDQKMNMQNFTDVVPTKYSVNATTKGSYDNSIGSIKVLQNNSVQVNLMHMNESSEPVDLVLSSDGGKTFKDIELNDSNLLLNLKGGKDYILKAKETGTNFNFTITASDKDSDSVDRVDKLPINAGCLHDNVLYNVGEEFHIGCTELCECTAPGVKECVPLVCPSHVGIELVSKGCVKWAPNPPAQPPNCCPRVARCLSDGTCNYQGTLIPNWSEVPISITGCEKRCFCENGELDCQDVCSPLPPVPPQSLRCPPGLKPAPVNISDEDCCKQWGCISKDSTGEGVTSCTPNPQNTTSLIEINTPMRSKTNKSLLIPNRSLPLIQKYNLNKMLDVPKTSTDTNMSGQQDENITVFTLDDYNSPVKTLYPDKVLASIKNKIKDTLPPPMPKNDIEEFSKWFEYQKNSNKQHKVKPQLTPETPGFYTQIHQKENKNNVFKTLHDHQGQVIKKVTPSLKKEYHLEVKYEPTTSAAKNPNYQYNNLFEPFPYLNAIDSIAHNVNVKAGPERRTQAEKPEQNLSKNLSNFRRSDVKLIIPVNSYTEDNQWAPSIKAIVPVNPQDISYMGMKPVKITPFTNGRKSHKKVSNMQLDSFDNLELLSQLDGESGVNRNLGRSADNFEVTKMGEHAAQIADSPSLSHPPFLPTIPPEIHFPDEDRPDYNQNNINRPGIAPEGPSSALPSGVHNPPSFRPENRKLTMITIQADSPTSVKMLFGLPPVLVGLRGSVDLRYTDKVDEDVTKWYSQVFAPADEILSTPRLEFRLTGLKPSTVYKIRGKLYLHNLAVEPESDVYSVRTLDLPSVVAPEEKRREIDTGLTVMDSNDTSAHISWRHFSEEELQFVDGIQVRYRPVGTPIYSMTELLHHSRSNAELHDLRPGSRYEASLVLVPPPKATTELHDPGRVEFTTSPYIDPYNWSVTIEARAVGSEAAELTWHGVPSPAERWVRVYRAAHACGGSRKEHDAFRLATRDVPPTLTLTNLEPKMRCRVWLELFLTNGKVKTSNVLEINTKSLNSGDPIDNTIEASSIAGSRTNHRSDYYGALVVVGVVAALGALTSLLLLLVVLRRHRPRSVPITPVPNAPRESSLPPYDNPAYKLELQQETVDL